MNKENIKKFYKLVKKGKIIYFSHNWKISFPSNNFLNYPYKLEDNEIILSFQNSIYIVYNTDSQLIECIFDSEPEYIQSEYYLNDFTINDGYIDYCFQYLLLNPKINLSNCLALGLGIGNIPNALIQQFNKKITLIDCVEINKTLCIIYKEFFSVSKKIKIYNEKAEDFIIKTFKLYDYMFIDIPCFIINKKFMKQIKKISKKNCLIQINLIGIGIKNIDIKNIFLDFIIIKYKVISENNIFIIKTK